MDASIATGSDMTALSYYRGRVALYAILKALEMGHGAEVLLQAFTCRAVPEAIVASGARPVYIDIDETGYNMDAEDLRQKITSKTKAIVVQHTYGIPANMDTIVSIAGALGIPVIEDCCHTFASMYQGKLVGSLGVGSFYSFEWGKPIAAGIGGTLQINDPVIKERVLADYVTYRSPDLLSQAKIEIQYYVFALTYRPSLYWTVRSMFRWFESFGLAVGNYNPVGERDIAIDFCLRMMPRVKKRLKARLLNARNQLIHSLAITEQYGRRISTGGVTHPIFPEGCDVVLARYPLRVNNKKELLSKAKDARVEIADWYSTPVHDLKDRNLSLVYYETGCCPNAEIRCNEVVTLPVHKRVGQRDIDRAVDLINSIDT